MNRPQDEKEGMGKEDAQKVGGGGSAVGSSGGAGGRGGVRETTGRTRFARDFRTLGSLRD